MRWFLPLITLIVLNSLGLRAQSLKSSPELLNFFNHLYNYRSDLCLKELEHIEKQENWIAAHIAGANYHWWLLVTGENENQHKKALKIHNQVLIQKIENQAIESLDAQSVFAIIHAYAYETRYALMKKRYYAGLSNLLDINKYLKISLKNPELNDEYRLLAGLYLYMAAVTLEERPLFKPFFPKEPQLDKEKGYQLLVQCARGSHPLISTEAKYFLMKINHELVEDQTEAIKWVNILLEQYPGNLLYHYYKVTILQAAGETNKARAAFRQLQKEAAQNHSLSPKRTNHFIKELESVF